MPRRGRRGGRGRGAARARPTWPIRRGRVRRAPRRSAPAPRRAAVHLPPARPTAAARAPRGLQASGSRGPQSLVTGGIQRPQARQSNRNGSVIVDLRALQLSAEIDVPDFGLRVELVDLPAPFAVPVTGLFYAAERE